MSAYHTAINRTRIVNILEVVEESPTVRTFIFQDKLCQKAEAGQFVMVWIPGVDEVPMSLSTINHKGLSSITVASVGEATRVLHQRKTDDTLGIRGPYGNGFILTRGKAMIVGGGAGLAVLVPLVERLVGVSTQILFLLGAKTRDELLFLGRIEKTLSKAKGRVIATTEDGSFGLHGVVTEPAQRILAKEKFGMVYACGPEQMMHKIFIATERHNAPLQVSLERLMHCAIGLCGSCTIGRFRVCRDGPVFHSHQLREVESEFGHFKRGFDGRRINP